MVSTILLLTLVLVVLAIVLLAGRDPLVAALTQLGRLLASPFDAILSVLERVAEWLIVHLAHGWAAVKHHRGADGDEHLVLDGVVSLAAAVAVGLLAYTDLALTALSLGPIFGLSVPFNPKDIVLYLSWSFLVGVAVCAFVAWEMRPHHLEEAAPPYHSSALGLVSPRWRARLFAGMLLLLGASLIASICGMLWRLQATADVMDYGAAGVFLVVYAALVAVALALATIIAIRSLALVLALAGEFLLIADWLAAVLPWLVIRIEDALIGLLVAIVDLGHAVASFVHRSASRNAEVPVLAPREPISEFVQFPAFIFQRHPRLVNGVAPQPGSWSDEPMEVEEPVTPVRRTSTRGGGEDRPAPSIDGNGHDPSAEGEVLDRSAFHQV